MTKLLLDSGNPQEYREIGELLKQHGQELWGSTTNPSLIAKTLAGKKVSHEEAFSVLQKGIIEEILTLIPGAVSGEVYAAKDTKAEDMTTQGKTIATWGDRVVVKLPTTIEGFKARTELRKLGITINNTLVFSQEQVFAITLHEQLMNKLYGKPKSGWPSFISPFVGRLDDIGQDGMSMIVNSVHMINKYFETDTVWMLEASVRTPAHFKHGLALHIDMETVPAKVLQEWFGMSETDQQQINIKAENLAPIPAWDVEEEFLAVDSENAFMELLNSGKLNISHELTDKGIDRFVADWEAILI